MLIVRFNMFSDAPKSCPIFTQLSHFFSHRMFKVASPSIGILEPTLFGSVLLFSPVYRVFGLPVFYSGFRFVFALFGNFTVELIFSIFKYVPHCEGSFRSRYAS